MQFLEVLYDLVPDLVEEILSRSLDNHYEIKERKRRKTTNNPINKETCVFMKRDGANYKRVSKAGVKEKKIIK